MQRERCAGLPLGSRVQSCVGGASRPRQGQSLRNTVVMVVLAILAAATWVATWQGQDAAPPAERVKPTEPLGYYVRGARLTGTDDQGRLTFRVFAERLDEVPGEEQLELTGVNVHYQPADETAWTL